MNKLQKMAISGSILMVLLLYSSYTILKYVYPAYREHLIRKAEVENTKDGLSFLNSDQGSASAALLREYRNLAFKRGMSILSGSSLPNLNPPILLYATVLRPEANKRGMIELFWLEYDFDVNGIEFDFADGSAEQMLVFPVWDNETRHWFRAQVHRDANIVVNEGTSLGITSAYPNQASIRFPIDRMNNIRMIRLVLKDGRVSVPVDVFFYSE